MERVMTVEEKIRRAEEIYERRKRGEVRPVAKVAVNDKKDIKLLKKMIIQILICVSIYLIVYAMQNSQYVFSKDFINKANEVLSYDTNFMEIYEIIKGQVMSIIQQDTDENLSSDEAIGGAEEVPVIPETQNVEEVKEEIKESLSQEEMDIQNIKNTTSFIKPVEGVISSKYGLRETATGTVPKNHTGTDIAVNMGTKIISATEGEVVLASEEGDYRETFKNSNWRSKYYLCTLQ